MSITATPAPAAAEPADEARARWAAMLARGRVIQPLALALLAAPGATRADAAGTLRTWADLIEGGVWPPDPQPEPASSLSSGAGSPSQATPAERTPHDDP